MFQNKNAPHGALGFVSAPTGIRTPVVALKGLRPSPLDDGGKRSFVKRADFIIPPCNGQAIGYMLHESGYLGLRSHTVRAATRQSPQRI